MMSEGIILDIGLIWWSKQQPGVISSVIVQKDNLNKCLKYRYSKAGNVKLIGFSYNGKKLSRLLVTGPIDNILNVEIYFKASNSTFLLVNISTSTKNYYFVNHETYKPIDEKTEFDEFFTVSPLGEDELEGLLDELFTKGKLNYYDLSTNLRERLIREGGVMFDLNDHKHGMSYVSEENIQVMVTEDCPFTGYKTIQHFPLCYKFWIKGIKGPRGEIIRVEGHFPNYPLNFVVYYNKGDNNHDNPLLIVINLDENTYNNPEDNPSKCMISKNSEGNWNILTVNDSGIDENVLEKILQNIVSYGKLDVDQLPSEVKDKLVDITKNITVDLDKISKHSYTYYGVSAYQNVKIPVDYYITLYSNPFYAFTIWEIKTLRGTITGDKLPTSGTKMWKITLYHKGICADAILIEVTTFYAISSGSQKAVYYYYRDDKGWQSYKLETQVEIRNDGREDHRVTRSVAKYIIEKKGKITSDDLKGQGLGVNLEPYPKIEKEEVPTENPTEEPTGPSTPTPNDTVDTESTSSESSPPKGSGNAGAIVGGIIGTLVCAVALSFVIWRIGPSLRTYMAGREPLLLSSV